MAGGTFTISGKKVRPGTYINTKSGKQSTATVNLEGAVVLPLIGASYGLRRSSSRSTPPRRTPTSRSWACPSTTTTPACF